LFYKEEKYGPSACVGVDKDAHETIEHANIANEVVIEGKVYPVTHTMLGGFLPGLFICDFCYLLHFFVLQETAFIILL